MPKKSLTEKKEEIKEREDTKKKDAKAKATKEAEDAYWRQAGEGSSRQEQRREEEEKKRAEAAAKKAELKRLQEQEEAALTARKNKLAPAGTQKMTKYQLDKQRELEEELKEEQARERLLVQKREVDAGSYSRIIDTENTNRVGAGVVDVRGVDHALAALTVGEAPPEEKHPEKRMKAAWKAYEERMLVEMKQEKPGLKLAQYRDLIWKAWQKSPENPINQAAAAAAATSKA